MVAVDTSIVGGNSLGGIISYLYHDHLGSTEKIENGQTKYMPTDLQQNNAHLDSSSSILDGSIDRYKC